MEETAETKVPLAVTLVFYVLGNAILLPWNFFITAESYWQYKLRNTSLDDGNDGDAWMDGPLTPLQLSFTPTLVIISNTFSTIFFFVTSAIVERVSEELRIYGSLSFSLIVMFLVTILTFINTDAWQQEFYVITMVFVAALSMCMAVTQGSGSGLAGQFPASCMATLMSGQAIAGVVSSLARIVSLLVGEEPVTSGLVFFAISDVFLVLTIAGYFWMRRMAFYREVKKGIAPLLTESEKELATSRIKIYFGVLRKIWPMAFSVALALLITIAVFPAVTVYITSSMQESSWTKTFFQPTATFLVFNVGDVLGREITRWVRWPSSRGWLLHVFGAARVIFIPLLMLCHGDNKTFPTIFENDAIYIILNLLFAVSNGYMITITFIYYQEFVKDEELEMGGTIMVVMVGIGLVVGSLLSPALVLLWGAS